MLTKASRFRLRSSAFIRAEEENQIEPKKALFLSVEGDETERNYFEHLQRYIDISGYNSLIHIEILRHKRGDGYSSPEQVVELLNEYVNIRHGELIPEGLPETFTNEYTKDMIKSYLEDPHSFSKAERNKINDDLMKIGIDLEYRKYLKMFDQDSDCFAVILDRDCGNHSRQLMIECIEICKERGYGCYISNPCFEFWLLLHLCDVKLEYADRLTELLINKKISKRHTYVSNEVSQRAHHNKQINANVFLEKYLPQIPQAINNSKGFALDLEEILDELGSNLSELFQIIGYDGA
ncbi:RloB family protein [Lacrimispora sp. AGF001]|uniref:RloB family protein n=1 Tax=Lacrimispora sp. AGF001 TaxID=3401631 RepID=UPI003B434C7A